MSNKEKAPEGTNPAPAAKLSLAKMAKEIEGGAKELLSAIGEVPAKDADALLPLAQEHARQAIHWLGKVHAVLEKVGA